MIEIGWLYWLATAVYMVCIFLPLSRAVVLAFFLSTVVLFIQALHLGADNLLALYGAAVVSNLTVLLFWR